MENILEVLWKCRQCLAIPAWSNSYLARWSLIWSFPHFYSNPTEIPRKLRQFLICFKILHSCQWSTESMTRTLFVNYEKENQHLATQNFWVLTTTMTSISFSENGKIASMTREMKRYKQTSWHEQQRQSISLARRQQTTVTVQGGIASLCTLCTLRIITNVLFKCYINMLFVPFPLRPQSTLLAKQYYFSNSQVEMTPLQSIMSFWLWP